MSNPERQGVFFCASDPPTSAAMFLAVRWGLRDSIVGVAHCAAALKLWKAVMNSLWFVQASLIGKFHAPYAYRDDRADLQQLEPDRVRAGPREYGD